MSPELSRRLGRAMGSNGAVISIRQRMLVAKSAQDDAVQSFQDLPGEIQNFIRTLENASR